MVKGTIKIILNISESVSPRNEAVLDSFWLVASPQATDVKWDIRATFRQTHPQWREIWEALESILRTLFSDACSSGDSTFPLSGSDLAKA